MRCRCTIICRKKRTLNVSSSASEIGLQHEKAYYNLHSSKQWPTYLCLSSGSLCPCLSLSLCPSHDPFHHLPCLSSPPGLDHGSCPCLCLSPHLCGCDLRRGLSYQHFHWPNVAHKGYAVIFLPRGDLDRLLLRPITVLGSWTITDSLHDRL